MGSALLSMCGGVRVCLGLGATLLPGV